MEKITTVSELVKILNDPNNKKPMNIETSGILDGLQFGQISGVAYAYSILYENSKEDSPFVSVRARILNNGEDNMLYETFYNAAHGRDFVKVKGTLAPQPSGIIEVSDITVKYTREQVDAIQRIMNSDML